MRCKAYKNRCPNKNCDYRYYRTQPLFVCPKCNTPRMQCSHPAITGYNYCQYHGGPNPKFNFYGLGTGMKDGSKSSFPLTRLASKYIQMKNDGRLLSNRASIELIRKRVEQLAERIDLNDAPDRLENIHNKWEKYKSARGYANERILEHELDEEFEKAYHDYASWKQMFEAVDLDRKLVESEVKVIKDIHAVLTVEDAYELTAQLMASIITTINSMEGVSDILKTNALKRIQYEFTRIVGDRDKQGFGGSGAEDNYAESGELDRSELHDTGDSE